MMMTMNKEELLRQAVEAHEAYVRGVREVQLLQECRRKAFLEATHGAVSNTELARESGLSNSQVGNILRGRR